MTQLKNVQRARGTSEATNTAAEATRVAGASGAGAKAEKMTAFPLSGVGLDLERTTVGTGVGHGIARNDATEAGYENGRYKSASEAEKGRRCLLNSVL